MNILGRALYLTVMKTMLDIFSCEYDEATTAWYLLRNNDIDCFTEDHSLYLALGAVGILVYYPAATLLLPNL